MHTCCGDSLQTICCCLLFPCCACWAVHSCLGCLRSQAVDQMKALCVLRIKEAYITSKPPVTFLGGADIRGLWRQLALQTHASTCRSWSVSSHPALLRLLKRPLGQWVSNLPRKKKRRDTECHQDWLHCKEVRVSVQMLK